MIRLAVVALALVLATEPAQAEPNAQLVSSVQHRLNILGYQRVDASSLTTRQIAMLHLKLQGPLPGGGFRWMNLRQETQVILNLDGFALRD
ncbi:MAG: hypothetical protein AAF919_05765 [Pseudomonadota bacterium]